MLALIQRVTEAAVRIDGVTVGAIGPGLLVFFCAERGDAEADLDRFAQRLLRLRCFGDEAGRMNRSVQDLAGGLLVVSQFTLAADTASGNRPGFTGAAAPDEGSRLYEAFVARLRGLHPVVETGRFGADMKVSLVNDGPVTLWLRSPAREDRADRNPSP
ncbi:D-aminoacyl-tRNA deacylase [Zeimonas arvi]|uniref:D-aminoacyl-tRNA deacylase n=1 Tax=Zeimonas arvi TaxID=2498847 RepID=A0A5C8NYN5_9BURK|nr:D-aminoacyl-tRNA deacylase [Zeimonas arvi]TXL66398.1 D-tyrosyl-tRNA(Tyr) deacylase [Zeimonas arvi]